MLSRGRLPAVLPCTFLPITTTGARMISYRNSRSSLLFLCSSRSYPHLPVLPSLLPALPPARHACPPCLPAMPAMPPCLSLHLHLHLPSVLADDSTPKRTGWLAIVPPPVTRQGLRIGFRLKISGRRALAGRYGKRKPLRSGLRQGFARPKIFTQPAADTVVELLRITPPGSPQPVERCCVAQLFSFFVYIPICISF